MFGPHREDAAAIAAAGGIPRTITHNLMVDTGAQCTCIEDAVAKGLGLIPIRFAQMMGVSGKAEEYPVYRMSITIGMSEDGTGAPGQAVFSADVVGTPSPPKPLTHVGLLGRDFLQHVKLVYDGPAGAFDLIDYRHVSEPRRSIPKPPALGGWKQIESARKKSKKHRRHGRRR